MLERLLSIYLPRKKTKKLSSNSKNGSLITSLGLSQVFVHFVFVLFFEKQKKGMNDKARVSYWFVPELVLLLSWFVPQADLFSTTNAMYPLSEQPPEPAKKAEKDYR